MDRRTKKLQRREKKEVLAEWLNKAGNKSGVCCYCGAALDFYNTKLIARDGERVCCMRHGKETKPPEGFWYDIHNWRFYTDG